MPVTNAPLKRASLLEWRVILLMSRRRRHSLLGALMAPRRHRASVLNYGAGSMHRSIGYTAVNCVQVARATLAPPPEAASAAGGARKTQTGASFVALGLGSFSPLGSPYPVPR